MWGINSEHQEQKRHDFPSLGCIDINTAHHYLNELRNLLGKNGQVFILSAFGGIGFGHLREANAYAEYCALGNIPYQHWVLDVGNGFVPKLYAKAQNFGILTQVEAATALLPNRVINYGGKRMANGKAVSEAIQSMQVNRGGPILIVTTYVAAAYTANDLIRRGVFGNTAAKIAVTPDPWKGKEYEAMVDDEPAGCEEYSVTHDIGTARECLSRRKHLDDQHILPWGTPTNPMHMLGLAGNKCGTTKIAVDFSGNPHRETEEWTKELLTSQAKRIQSDKLAVAIHTVTHRKHFEALTDCAKKLGLYNGVEILYDSNPFNAVSERDSYVLGKERNDSATCQRYGQVPPGSADLVCGKGEGPLMMYRGYRPDGSVYNNIPFAGIFGDGHEGKNVAAGQILGNPNLVGASIEQVVQTAFHASELEIPTVPDNPLMALWYAASRM
ncbi:MAG: hypothetical protein NUV65_05045 [Candidatus Roizmanbacteria bacterium]|nr:hypothetical protein [Candidatus Roizmanbacteria bacterium]